MHKGDTVSQQKGGCLVSTRSHRNLFFKTQDKEVTPEASITSQPKLNSSFSFDRDSQCRTLQSKMLFQHFPLWERRPRNGSQRVEKPSEPLPCPYHWVSWYILPNSCVLGYISYQKITQLIQLIGSFKKNEFRLHIARRKKIIKIRADPSGKIALLANFQLRAISSRPPNGFQLQQGDPCDTTLQLTMYIYIYLIYTVYIYNII